MTWNLNRIPKKAFFFWGTESLPWVRYLALETFRKHHPDWEVLLYKLPELQPNTKDYDSNSINYWSKIDNLDIKVETIDIEKYLNVNFPCKFITIYADIFRYIVLNIHGGFYADMDHLFFRPLEAHPCNSISNNSRDVFLLKMPYHHFLFGTPGAKWWNKVLNKQLETLPQDINQFLNTTACTERVVKEYDDNLYELDFSTTEENFDVNGPKNDYAIALNWHGSGVDSKYNVVNESNYMTSDHPLAACIRYCLTGSIGKDNGIGTFEWIGRYS